MYLYINCSIGYDLQLQLVDRRSVVGRRIKNGQRSEKFLNSLLDFLKTNQVRHKLSGLILVIDQGSYSQVRQAVALVNALAYAWAVPIIKLRKAPLTKADLFKVITGSPRLKMVKAVYSGLGVG